MTLDVGGAFLSAFLAVLFQKLASWELLNYCLFEWHEIKEPLMKLASTASKIKAVLEDAVEKQVKDAAVRMWLDDLHDLVDDAEDLLEDVEYEALRCQAEAGSETGSNVFAILFTSANAVVFKASIVRRVTKITERLEDIAEQRAKLGLVVREEAPKVRPSRSTTTSLAEDCIFGRVNDVNNIRKLLVGDGEPVAVIPIVGLGGVGKTTVAQVLYNDGKVRSHFKVQAWAFVSHDFDLVKITRDILESLGESCDYTNLEPLQCHLKLVLSGKKYLLVLDDVWTEDYLHWEVLLRPLRSGAKGSKVIVTTRNEKVALTVRTTDIPICHLKELSFNDCWSLFAKNANFANVTLRLHNKLEKIGKKIVSKCKGLPLAAKALGGLLRSRLDIDEWRDVANSKIWDSSEQSRAILPALSLSYHHLPYHLKPCFAYCSIFPKGHEFEEEELVNLWIAQGFVQQTVGENKQMEDLGRKYFRELLSRSLFQCSSGNNVKSLFLMHDLINDLAQFVAGESCFRLEGKDCSHDMTCSKARHFSYIRRGMDTNSKFEALNLSKLRTILPLDGGFRNCRLMHGVTDDLLPKCERLRVLSLSHYDIAELPSSIDKLKHLGYLDLSHTKIKKLPDSTATLYNLKTLILCSCTSLNKLPADLRNLSNLRCLNVLECTSLKMLPLQMGRLKNLRTLPCFIIGENGGSGIQELRDLDNLQGELSIIGLQNVKSPEKAKSADLNRKQYLNKITLAWGSSAGGLEAERLAMNVLDMLEPHVNIKSLSISDYGGGKLSSWLGNPLYDNIVSVVLTNCKNCTALPPLGQLPSLKDLVIEGMNGVEIVGHEFYSDGDCLAVPFPSLQTLKFHNMPAWKQWSSIGPGEGSGFPCLRELYLHDCPVLSGEVPNLPSLTVIEIHKCKELQVLPRLLMLQKIVLEECHEAILRSVVGLTSVEELQIRRFLNLNCLPEGLLGSLNALRALEVIGCHEITTLSDQVSLSRHTSLRRIAISHCSLSTLADEEHGLPRTIEHLEIRSCNLEGNLRGLQDLTSLAELRIISCPRIQSFSLNGSLPRLRRLEIEDCEALKSLPEGLTHSENVSLEFLEIVNCSSLGSFPRGELPTNLKELKILGCSSLANLPDGLQKSPSLECLHIRGCPFTSFPVTNNTGSSSASTSTSSGSISTFFPKLEELKIEDCSEFVSFPYNLHNFINLNKLSIKNCPSFESFPQGGLPSKLTSLSILECKNLKSLPSRMHHLTSLEKFTIHDCPLLDSFPKLGLPSSLKSLQITMCNRFPPLCKWEFEKLKMLTNYIITGDSPSF